VTQPPVPGSRRAARDAAQSKPNERAPRAEGTTAPSGGIGGLIARNPTGWLAATLGVVFLLLGTGAVFAGAAVGSNGEATPGPSSSADAGRPVPAAMPAASRLRTCSIAALATDPRLMGFTGAVMNASTGELLFDRSATAPVSQGSVLKVLTAAAALNILGPDYQLSTRVFEGSLPGTIVLVGGGDPTISQLGPGQESIYPGAPKLSDLANQVKDKYSGPVTTIVLDSSMWSVGDKWDSTWKRSEQTTGYLSEVTALQVDGDRDDPRALVSPRSTDPVLRAGKRFAEQLQEAGVDIDPDHVTFTSGTAVTTKPKLGEVSSQPISVLINQMLVNSDGTLAETMARVISWKMGLGGTAVSLSQAISSSVAIYEVDTSRLTIRDGSGLSTSNAVPPEFMAEFMIRVMQGGANLNIIYNSLAVAGKTGVLAKRFTGANAVAKGAVIAKTGWLDTEYSLAGIINAADGTQLSFAFYAIGAGIKDNAKAALDTLATGAFNCGGNLSNN
jgi:D-alanyl-D-alanine carboxypeptidase/D-alanyl-D-alanine-endopeptidase (penicillin-binding protein 4)